MSQFTCPACGYPSLTEEPRTEESGGSYEICPSCGFEFGVTDDDQGYTYASWRQKWIDAGMPWDADGLQDPPQDWDPKRQLENVTSGSQD